MADIREPHVVTPEHLFEEAIVSAVHFILEAASRQHVIIPRFGFDTAIFIDEVNEPAARFIEAKSYAGSRAGAIGFGDGRGGGQQAALLMRPESETRAFSRSIRWAFADAQ